jgi:hypothetical protein
LAGFAINNSDNSLHAVLEVGGFLGMGANEVTYNLDDMRLGEDSHLTIGYPVSSDAPSVGFVEVNPRKFKQRNAVATIPTASPLAYLFAASNVLKEASDLAMLHWAVNKN